MSQEEPTENERALLERVVASMLRAQSESGDARCPPIALLFKAARYGMEMMGIGDEVAADLLDSAQLALQAGGLDTELLTTALEFVLQMDDALTVELMLSEEN